ncbi:MAG: hypothetical protein ACI4PE_03425 [Bacilli bacterium]
MAKNKVDKKINRIAKRLNRELKKDVFGDRFWIKQVARQRGDYEGCFYYLYELKDRLEPNRDTLFSKGWIWGSSQFLVSEFYEEVNDFIVRSDFWSKYHNDPERYDPKQDYYLNCFNKLV